MKKKLRKWKKKYFWQKHEGVKLHDGNFDGEKTIPYSCRPFWGRIVSVSSFSAEKNQLQIGRKMQIF